MSYPYHLIIIRATLTAFHWFRDIDRESTKIGFHSRKVAEGMKKGILLFICSEIIFFISFFWAFFHRLISLSPEIGIIWPPYGVDTFNPLRIPLLNTILLLSSGITITLTHHYIIKERYKLRLVSLILTVLLGIFFIFGQWVEYKRAMFTLSDSTYGSVFFILTGFHGTHVILGVSFLLVTLARFSSGRFSKYHIVGFECAAWYWHFVDVVWLFLYVLIYWWGS